MTYRKYKQKCKALFFHMSVGFKTTTNLYFSPRVVILPTTKHDFLQKHAPFNQFYVAVQSDINTPLHELRVDIIDFQFFVAITTTT